MNDRTMLNPSLRVPRPDDQTVLNTAAIQAEGFRLDQKKAERIIRKYKYGRSASMAGDTSAIFYSVSACQSVTPSFHETACSLHSLRFFANQLTDSEVKTTRSATK